MQGMVGGCCTSAQGAERKKAQVEDQIDALENAIYLLSENVDRLTAKLTPVTRQVEPQCTACMNEEQLVPVAESIKLAKNRVAGISDQIESLFMRVEL